MESKGHCKHGEFILTEGCPECIAERRAAESKLAETEAAAVMGTPYLVKVQYFSQTTGEISDREYTYFAEEPLAVGDVVKVPVRGGYIVSAKVSAVDVPESEIAAFRDKVKTILKPTTVIEPAGLAAAAQAAGAEVTEAKVELKLFPDPGPYGVQEWPEAGPPSTGPNPPAADIGDAELEATQDEGPTEGEHVEQLWDEQKAVEQGKPAALVTIERQVGKPTSELFQLYQEAASLLQFAKTRVIATNEDLKPATNDLAIIATCKKAMFARKTEFVGPLKAKLDLVNQAFADLMFPVEEADRLTRGQVTAFDNEQRKKAAAAARIEDEKLRLAREEAALNGTGEITVPLGTAVAPPPVPERTRTDLGTLGGRDNWKARVVNFKLLSDEWKLPNESLLNSHARTTKGTRPIPGVEFYNERSVTMRTK